MADVTYPSASGPPTAAPGAERREPMQPLPASAWTAIAAELPPADLVALGATCRDARRALAPALVALGQVGPPCRDAACARAVAQRAHIASALANAYSRGPSLLKLKRAEHAFYARAAAREAQALAVGQLTATIAAAAVLGGRGASELRYQAGRCLRAYGLY